ncbi:MAG: methionyl-tRNA formyltransferase [Schleiferiaceae bacterium]
MSSRTDTRIVYMGTPEFAVPPLEALIEAGYTIPAVITVADKPAGRGRKLRESAVKVCAVSNGLKVLQPTNLKDEDFIAELRSLKADLFIVVAFRMLPEVVWSMPALGTFNLHGSLLPKYRGAAPIHWAIINGDRATGLTTFLLDKKIDTGGTLLQVEHPINEGMTTGELHNELMSLGPELVLNTVEGLVSGTLSPIAQNNELATHAPKLNKDNSKLDLTRSPSELTQQILGLNPFPGSYYGDFKFMRARVSSLGHASEKPVLRVSEKRLFLDYPHGSVEITEIKPNGKKNMDAKSFINGLKVAVLPLD